MVIDTATELTTGEAARHAKVAIQTIHNWIDRGELQAREEWHGKKRVRFVNRASLDRLLRSFDRPADVV